jgi:hypothetical protein
MFTFVAACAVLGVRWNGHPVAAWLLGGLALAAWLGLAPLALADVGSRPVVNLRNAPSPYHTPSVERALSGVRLSPAGGQRTWMASGATPYYLVGSPGSGLVRAAAWTLFLAPVIRVGIYGLIKGRSAVGRELRYSASCRHPGRPAEGLVAPC